MQKPDMKFTDAEKHKSADMNGLWGDKLVVLKKSKAKNPLHQVEVKIKNIREDL